MCSNEVLLPIPSHLWKNDAVPDEGAEHVLNEAGEHCISVDECIVPAIRALWDAGIVTLSSCCGHVAEGDDHPYGVITIQTKPGVRQRGATLLRRERYEELLASRYERDAAQAALTELMGRLTNQGRKCRICLDIVIDGRKPLTHHDWCPLRGFEPSTRGAEILAAVHRVVEAWRGPNDDFPVLEILERVKALAEIVAPVPAEVERG